MTTKRMGYIMYSTTSLIKKVILSNFVLVSGGEYKRKRSFPDFLSGFIRQELMGREESNSLENVYNRIFIFCTLPFSCCHPFGWTGNVSKPMHFNAEILNDVSVLAIVTKFSGFVGNSKLSYYAFMLLISSVSPKLIQKLWR